MVLLWLLAPLVSGEIFNSLTDREPYYKELNDRWQFMAKFPYSTEGAVRVRVQFRKDDDCLMSDVEDNNAISCPMLHWYTTTIAKWKRKLDVADCSARLADSSGVEHIQLKLDQTIENTECAVRGEYMICEVNRTVSNKWGFIAASYCGGDLTEIDFNWEVVSTNGGRFVNKHPPATERHFFTLNLVMAIISTLLVLFWLIYPNPVKLNSTLLLVYKVSLWCCAIAFWLFLGSNSTLNSSGERNFSLNITASVLSFISLALLAHVTVVVAYSGSLVTVQLSRVKMVISYIIAAVYFALNVAMLICEVMLWDDRTRVYILEMDSIYIWVVVGLYVILWVHNTVFTILNMVSAATEDRSYYKVFYIFFSIIILSVPIVAWYAVLNMSDYVQYLLVVAWCSTVHVVCYLFLFLLMKDNHSLASLWSWFKLTFCTCWSKICCCMPFCGKDTGASEVPFCLRCCPCIAMCCPCFMCCACCKIKGDKRYGSESNLQKESLVDTLKREKERKPSGFDLNLVDIESSDTVIANTPVILEEPSVSPVQLQPPVTAQPSTSSDAKISVTTAERHASNVKVIPWLDQTSPAYKHDKGLSEHGYSNRVEPKDEGSLKPKAPLYRFNSENLTGRLRQEGRPAAQFIVKSYDGSESVRSDIGKQGNRSLDWDTEGPRWSKRGWSHTNPTGPMVERSASNEDPVIFNTASYNSDKIRDEKVIKTTMRYRRNTLKHTLSKVPSHVLLERIRQAHADTEGGLPGKVRVVKSSARPAAPERSKSKLWRMLSNRYDDKKFTTKEDKLRTTAKMFSGGKDRWK